MLFTRFFTLVLNSITGILGVSSMYRGAFDRFLSLYSSCSHSNGSSLEPPFILSAGRPDSLVMSRLVSCTADISRENTATGIWWSTAALRAMFSARAVFPMDGRAARIMRSDFCHPMVMESRVTNPEGTPLSPVVFCIFCMSPMASLMRAPMSCTSFLRLFWMASNILVWALSMRSSTFTESS